MRKSPLQIAGLTLASLAIVVFSLFPVWVMVTRAFDPGAGSGRRSVIPSGFSLEHFVTVLERSSFPTYLMNSLVVALVTVVASGLLALFAAVAVARFRFSGRTKILMMILIIQMIPIEALVIPLFLQAKTLGLLNSLLGLSVIYIAFSLSFAIWTLRGFVAGIPVELEEAAYLDGASWWQMFWRVLFPLVAPGLVAVSVFSFILAWNEFIFALTFMSDGDKYTAAVGLRTFFTRGGTDWGSVMAASTLITMPVLLFFVAVQSRLSSGLMSGATKG